METAFEMASEMKARVHAKKAYLMFVNGREHNIYVEDVGNFYIGGKIALHKIAMLIDRPGRGGVVVRFVSPNEESHSVAPGEDLLLSEPCILPSKDLNLQIRLDRVDLVEDQWRPVVDNSVMDSEGKPIPSALCEVIPSFKRYLSPDGQTFAGTIVSVRPSTSSVANLVELPPSSVQPTIPFINSSTPEENEANLVANGGPSSSSSVN